MGRRASPIIPRPAQAPGREGGPEGERKKLVERRSGTARDRRQAARPSSLPVPVEAVFFYLHDVGRSVDLDKVASLVPAHPDLGIAKRRDTPASLTLPIPLVLVLGAPELEEGSPIESIAAHAKIYEEGVVTVVVRVRSALPLNELHRLESVLVGYQGGLLTIAEYAHDSFGRLFGALEPAIDEPRELGAVDNESYLAYCLAECGEKPEAFLERNREYLAGLLVGEESGASLHESQIAATLGSPFSYKGDDLAVFELDRCLIIDPRGDYADLLLIAEHANYQLLELRVLDKLLDTWLDEAESDIRRVTAGKRHLVRVGRWAEVKVAHIQALRFDALFILENLENSSKIIGDYYLGQVYSRMCELFNTDGWKWSVERRLDTLQDVYEMVKTDTDERKLRWLEIVIIVVCVVSPLIEILKLALKD
jgi:hypothetical protein